MHPRENHIFFRFHKLVRSLRCEASQSEAFLLMCTSCKNPHFYHTLFGQKNGGSFNQYGADNGNRTRMATLAR